MDIVTAGRACVRRWYLFIPILAIGIIASIHVANSTKPTYQASGEFLILGNAVQPINVPAAKATSVKSSPAVRVTVTRGRGTGAGTPTPTPTPTPTLTPTATPKPVPTTTVVNPYQNNQDVLRSALIFEMNSGPFEAELASLGGAHGSFTVAAAKKSQLFEVTAQARRRKQAVALLDGVLQHSNEQLRAVQLAAGAPATSLLRTQVLTTPTSASDVTSGKSKRLVAGIAITVAAALALSIALDSAMLARRRRRRAMTAGEAPDATPPTFGGGSGVNVLAANPVAPTAGTGEASAPGPWMPFPAAPSTPPPPPRLTPPPATAPPARAPGGLESLRRPPRGPENPPPTDS